MCDQAIAEAGTGRGTYGRYQLVQAPAVGGSGSQVVVGTAGPDRLVGGSGNDVLCGLGGDDTLDGGSGNDVLDGGPGDDVLRGGSGTDHLDGGAGFDRLFGGSGNDTLTNGEINDGGSGRTQILPGADSTSTSTQTFHYGTDGTLVNDTTADATTGTTATTASYLLTAGREARTLQPGTTTVGAVPNGAPAPVTTGAGTGYLLRDRHSSVTALVDANAAVTSTYSYGDYGPPALPNGQPRTPAASPAPGGQYNPFQYTGATPISSITDPTTGLLLLPARSYDPSQGRFTSRDSANVFNKYQGFSTNPIINVDPTGHFSLEDLLIDIGTAIVFTVAAIATAGAAFAGAAAIFAAEVGATTTSTIVSFAATAVTAYASAAGAVASAVKVADDVDDAVSGKHFLTNDQRSALGTAQMVAGAVAAVSGLAAIGAASAGAIAEGSEAAAVQDAKAFIADEDDSSSTSEDPSSTSVSKPTADPLLYPGDEIKDEWDELRVNDSSRFDDHAGSDSDAFSSEEWGRGPTVKPIRGRSDEPCSATKLSPPPIRRSSTTTASCAAHSMQMKRPERPPTPATQPRYGRSSPRRSCPR